MTRALQVIGAPSSAGAYAPGQEKAPATLRAHGLIGALTAAGREVHDRGDTPTRRWRADPRRPEAMNADDVVDTVRCVAEEVAAAVGEGHDVLVLGGDCTVEVGTVAGALAAGRGSLGLVYVDLDADAKTPANGEGAIDWMGVAHMLDIPGCLDELAAVGPRRPLLTGPDVLLLAQDNITGSETMIIDELGVEVVGLDDVHDDPAAAVDRVLEWADAHDRFLVHVDVDVLRWVDFPVAENSRRRDGLQLDELETVLSRLVGDPRCCGLTLCEVNPDHAPDEEQTFGRLVAVLASVLGRRGDDRRA